MARIPVSYDNHLGCVQPRPHRVDKRSLAFSRPLHILLRIQVAPIHSNIPQYHPRRQKVKGKTRVDGVLHRSRQEASDVGHNDDASRLPQDLGLPSTSKYRNHQVDPGAYRPPNDSSSKTGFALPVEAGRARARQCRCRCYYPGRSKTKT